MKMRKLRRIWGHPWDYAYLLHIEQRKLKEMAECFKKEQITTDWSRQVREIELCVKLIDIILEKDEFYKGWLEASYGSKALKARTALGFNYEVPFGKHINIHNAHRFSPNWKVSKKMPVCLQVEVRKLKALYLYNKIRAYRMLTWWS